MIPIVQVGDARKLPFRDRYFGLAFFSPPWDGLGVIEQARHEITRVLKKRGRWVMILPHAEDPELASLMFCNRDWSKTISYATDKPKEKFGPYYFSPSEDVVHKVLDMHPWVTTLIDPFCGSGTIVKAARERGLTAYGVDIDPEAVAVATERVA